MLHNIRRLKKYTKANEYIIFKKEGDRILNDAKNSTIFASFIRDVREGYKFEVDFKKRLMKTSKGTYILDEEWNQLYKLYDDPKTNTETIYMMEYRYKQYKYSVPSKESEKHKSKYFKAKHESELTDVDMITGKNRSLAQAALEGFILCAILSGDFKWDEEKYGKWFYQGKDKDFIILREWVEPNK